MAMVAAFIAAIVLLVWLFNYESPLESITMKMVSVKKGETLDSVCCKMREAIEPGWDIVLDDRLRDRISGEYFGGGGDAVIVEMVAKEFSCECRIIKDKHKIVLFLK